LDLQGFKIIEHAKQIGDSVWNEVVLWKHFERDTIGKQLVRATDSISANLSEAYGRYSFADRKRFAYYARGSLCETINWLNISETRGLIQRNTTSDLISEFESLAFRINVYIKRIKDHNP